MTLRIFTAALLLAIPALGVGINKERTPVLRPDISCEPAPALVPPGIAPKLASVAAGGTFQFTVTSPTVSPTVVSRNTAVATVNNSGLATGVSGGVTFIVASVYNGRCMTLDSARLVVSGALLGDSASGRVLWLANCQKCHGHRKADDVRFFAYDDSVIVRRALAHVNAQGALDIAAHVRALGPRGPLTPNTWLYQPGSPAVAVASDSMFGVTHMGSDAWPLTWTRDTLLAQNIRNVQIPLTLPTWGDELTRFDWLPGNVNSGQIPDTLLATSFVQNLFTTYYANENMTNAKALAEGLRARGHLMSVADAPCVYLDASNGDTIAQRRYSPQGCFDLAKWGAAFCYMAGAKKGLSADSILSACEKTWWETGHMAHKAQQFAGRSWCTVKCQIELRNEQIVAWIYLGSMKTWAANNDASLYFCGPAQNIGLTRWCTWYASMQMVRRPATTSGSSEACSDIDSNATFGHPAWLRRSQEFLLREMMYRLDHGLQLANSKDPCVTAADLIGHALQMVGNRAGQSTKDALKPLSDSVRARILAF